MKTTSSFSFTKDEVYNKLKTVIDPELEINIVDLGLIYDVHINKENKQSHVIITMTLTNPACPMAGSFEIMIKEALHEVQDLDGEKDVTINLVFEPPWNMDMMSEEARMELGF